MSIEQTLQNLADSQNALAAAMTRYAGVMESIAANGPTQIVTPAAANTDAGNAADNTEKKTTGRGRKPAETKPAEAPKQEAASEPDPFGGDDDAFGDSAKTYTADEIKALVLKVRDAKGADAAKAIIKAVGVSTLAQIDEKDYAKVADLCAKEGVK